MIRSIRNTAFTDNKFSTICTNIPVTPIGGEECYSHVLRALVYPRDKENTYNLQIANSNYAIPTERNTVYLISGENALSWLGENKSDIIAAGFKQNELVSLFVSKQKDVGWAFIDENNNRSIIYSEKIDSSFGRMLACIVQKLFPATFAGKPLDNDELDLVKSISRNDENMFADASQKLYDRLDLREMFIRSALSDIDVKFEKRSLERMKSEYTRIKSSIENLLRQLDDLYDKDHFNTLQIAALEENKARLGYQELHAERNIAKLSIVGAGMMSNPGVAAKMFESLYNEGVNINMISTSEIRVTVLINEKDGVRAMNAVHDAFNLAD